VEKEEQVVEGLKHGGIIIIQQTNTAIEKEVKRGKRMREVNGERKLQRQLQ